MIAVITGDIVNSRSVDPNEWHIPLRNFLSKAITDQTKWEIYRGDSFQIQTDISSAFELMLLIKALIKQVPKLDVRMSLGIGESEYEVEKITESYGQAYINSGEAFEGLKDKTLLLKTPSKDFDEYFNPILGVVSFIADQWKPETARAFFYGLYYKDELQKEISEKMGINNTTLSRALKRAAFDELTSILNLYSNKVKLCFS
ncbi:SatD family protein [Myroides pelagicus]|uniref:SatD family protein n=1 Tax=Myroides pelagicus TaxID=270914 RepID=UPI002DB6BE78|nr:SatD family protein [Myroides pelagicus]MEC4114113.1 SatD family protein [Myroides pelagicus]